ncbi:MAG TPA: hypothetical protein VK660_09650 [Xanthomonadaceae bacterium]|jgi:hypothetical protein|nr:hypothetical protein [Xanthomonadaceae bacterium]
MPCLFAILALMTPRIVIVLLWLFSHWFRGVFHDPLLWLAIGFVFAPTTLLWYVAVQHWFGGHWSLIPVVGLVIAIMIDVSPASGRRRVRND